MYICSFPQDQEIDEEFELLVLASDGLWDVVPNDVSPALSLSLSVAYPHTQGTWVCMCMVAHAPVTDDWPDGY